MLMKHCSRYLLNKNLFLFSSIQLMIIITSFLAFTLVTINLNIKAVQEEYHNLNQEDFQFIANSTAYDTTDPVAYNNAIKTLENKYGFESEIQRSKYASLNGNNYRIIKNNQKINQFYYVEGSMAVNQNEIVIDVDTAEEMKLSIGDTFEFLDNKYMVKGIASFSGLVNPNMSATNFQIYRSESSNLVSVNDKVYDSLNLEEKVYTSGLWLNGSQQISSDDASYVQESSHNPETKTLDLRIQMFQTIVGVSVSVMSSIVAIMLALILIRMIQENLKVFGILKAIGYRNVELVLSFIPLVLLLVIPVVIGLLIAELLQPFLFRFMNTESMIPFLNVNMDWSSISVVLAIYFLIVMTFSFSVIYLYLGKQPIRLIWNSHVDKNGLLKRILLKITTRKNFLGSLSYKIMFRNLFVLCLIIFSGFALAVQLFISFAMANFPNQIVNAVEEQYHYKYNTVFKNSLSFSKIDFTDMDAQGYVKRNMKMDSTDGSEDVSLIALETNGTSQYINFYDYDTHKDITGQLENGIIVSKWFANKYSLRVGDTVSVMDQDHTILLQIAGTHLELQGSELYTSLAYYGESFTEPTEAYHGLYSNQLLNIDSNDIRNTLLQSDIIEAMRMSVENYKGISGGMLVLGILLGGVLLSISISIAIKTGEKNILLFKSFGYTNREINRVCIIGNIYPLMIGIIVSIPYYIVLSGLLFGELSKSTRVFLPMQLTLTSVLIVIGGTILFFAIIASIYMMKLNKIKSFPKLLVE
ncbi:FtsX-like permease family protein [Paenibacillus crassostreae]|uniref:ABC3 transporter permease C-terminal domain-containing protein n=1 Tax=Paenibacillus crassostreae TaxID=1763538 RepID=A0A167FAU8_9BACL|nr:ABC transporter permease [Paenibacillus crassostreae]AOZ90870.1 hypothetical protein LPB68_00715 [Paenibacillus crassostreae]OAB76363.1 hypothetical protein PNBC_02820 [Paenibacillus crassostreae]